jgi:GH24 family phage-related lysozyme (muramidase)
MNKPTEQPKSAQAGPLSDSLIATVKDLEGFSPNAFGDYKQDSIGYGTRARSHNETLTKEEADARLREELSMHASRIDSAAQKAGVKLSERAEGCADFLRLQHGPRR